MNYITLLVDYIGSRERPLKWKEKSSLAFKTSKFYEKLYFCGVEFLVLCSKIPQPQKFQSLNIHFLLTCINRSNVMQRINITYFIPVTQQEPFSS